MAKFEEWLFKDAILKYVTADGLTTFQIQFTQDACMNVAQKDRATGQTIKDSGSDSSGKGLNSTKRGPSTGVTFTPSEKALSS